MNKPETTLPADPGIVTPLQIGDWAIRPPLNRLTKNDEMVQVERRIMHVLVCLASRPGEVISRNDLLGTVWGDTIVGEESLTVTISELRRIFGDDPKSPSYIETIRKGGYRLIAPVAVIGAQAQAPPEEDPAGKTTGGSRPGLHRRRFLAGSVAAAVCIIAILLIWRYAAGPSREVSTGILRGTPFTSYPRAECYPALSPDGTRVAFAWSGESGGNYDIYVKQKNTELAVRLTEDPAPESQPGWSPDGNIIAFVRKGEKNGIYTIPSIGGPARRLIEAETDITGFDWSPDGKTIAYSAGAVPGEFPRIALLSIETLKTEWLTAPTPESACDFLPSFSPDGQMIAFVRSSRPNFLQDIYLVPVDGGEVKRLTEAQRVVTGLDWAVGGREIIFTAAPRGKHQLWRVSVPDGSLRWMPTQDDWVQRLTLSGDGHRLVYEKMSYDFNIWAVHLDGSSHDADMNAPLIQSTKADFDADFSPDGTQILFLSARSGATEIWVSDRDGKNPRQVTSFDGVYLRNPRWSPNSSTIAFTAFPEGFSVIYTVIAEEGRPQKISQNGVHDVFSTWSRDGDWIYFESDRGDGWRIWKMTPEGRDIQTVTEDGIYPIEETAGGANLLHFRSHFPGIWKTSLNGSLNNGDAQRGSDVQSDCVIGGQVMASWTAWAAVDDGVYYIRRGSGGFLLGYCDLASGSTDSLAFIPRVHGTRLSVSPDRKTFLYNRAEQVECDLILVEEFR